MRCRVLWSRSTILIRRLGYGLGRNSQNLREVKQRIVSIVEHPLPFAPIFTLFNPITKLNASEAEGTHKHFRRSVFSFSIVRANTISNRRTASPIFFPFWKIPPGILGTYFPVPFCGYSHSSKMLHQIQKQSCL